MRLKTLFPSFLFLWSISVLYAYFSTHALLGSTHWDLRPLFHVPTLPALGTVVAKLSLLLCLVIIMILIGRGIWHRFRLPADGWAEECLLSAGLGAGIFMMVLFGLGLLGGWSSRGLGGLCILGAVGGVAANLSWLRDVMHRPFRPWRFSTWPAWDRVFFGMLAVFLLLYMISALGPETSYDSLAYHLAIPQQWLIYHRIIPTPNYCFSGIPFNMELLYGLALALSGPELPKLLHYACGVGTLGVIYILSKRYASRLSGLIACLIMVSPLMIALEFGRSSVDLGSTFFSLLAANAFLKGMVPASVSDQRRWLILSGVFCGLTMGTKYVTWTLLPSLGVALWWTERARGRGNVRHLLITEGLILVPACVLVLPWLIKNIFVFENPFYPFFNTFWPSPSGSLSNWAGLFSEGSRSLRGLLTWKGFWAYLKNPWATTMQGDFLGPAFLLFLPWLWYLRGTGSRIKPLIRVFLSLWILLSIGTFLPRFWLSALVLLAVLLGVSMSRAPRRVMGLSCLLLSLVLFSNFCWAANFAINSEGWKVVWGRMTSSEYLGTAHLSYGAPYFQAAEFINAVLPADAEVLILGDYRSLYVQRRLWVASAYDTQPIFVLANASADGDDLYARLKKHGITHLLLNAASIPPARPYWKVVFTPQGRHVFEAFWQTHTRQLFESHDLRPGQLRSVFVYELVESRRRLEPTIPKTSNPFLEVIDALVEKK